ncbi:MAG: DNA polymerase I [Anaerolineales bacterium]|nr:DNA polymerase I [Anaerolineales bacterium]
MSAKKPTLILIDGHALAYRAYFGMPATFSTAAGEPTHAVYGFANMLLAVWKEYNPDYFIVTFDAGDTFRHELYTEYKATREKMPDDLATQITRIEQLVKAFNMPVFTKEGFEADDLLGTLATQAAAQGIETLIVTGDRDAFQLVNPHIKVVYPGGQNRFNERKLYDEAEVEARFGVPPSKLVDLKAMVGDTSDNIPGIKGIGDKGAAKLLQQYGSLDEIYAHLADMPAAQRAKFEADRENAYLSQKLGRIITAVPDIELNVAAGKTMDFELTDVANLFVELEFNTIFNRIPGAPADKSPSEFANIQTRQKAPISAPDGQYITVDTPAQLADLVAKLQQNPRLAVDVETDSTDEVQANLVGIAITPVAGEGYYIPVGHGEKAEAEAKVEEGGQLSLFGLASEKVEPTLQPSNPPTFQPSNLPISLVQSSLAPILSDPVITKYMHNAKFDMTVLQQHGLPVAPPIFDTMVASWVGNNAPEARHGLKDLAREKLNLQMTEIKELIGSGKSQITMAQVPVEKVTPYAAADVDMTLRLVESVQKPLRDIPELGQIFYDMELPLIYVLKDMELAGVKLDTSALGVMSKQMAQRLAELEHEIHRAAGLTFNINSTQQLSDLLFNKLGLPTEGLSKTKSGHYSTAAGVLEELKGKHEVIDLILEHRGLTKLKSTYVDALPLMVNPKTGRVHTNYNQIGISTGRLSSSEPNLQNIPIRTEQGREIRRAFIAAPGCRLISADYSQVELRILAHVVEDPNLLAAFAHNEDIHAATAATVLGIPLEQVDKYQRRIAKTVNFGLIYGQTAFGLAQNTGMSRDEARLFIDKYFEKYPGIKRYIDETKRLAVEQGYLTTLLGRRRDFSNLARLTGPQRASVEREAINMPIQGTAADIMKIAMIRLHQALKARNLRSRMLLQVHDELVLEAPEDEVAATAELTHQVMSQAYDLKSDLKVEVESGYNWLEMEPVGQSS